MSDTGKVFEDIFSNRKSYDYLFDRNDLIGKYVRQRRAVVALRMLHRAIPDLGGLDCLFVCGGAGESARVFVAGGIGKVTVSDISESALRIAKELEPRLETRVLDAERLPLPDGSYDVVVVQDGLPHLSSPPGGLAEMLRVARRAVVMMEPATGLVSRILGREYERSGGRVLNYVFRWDRRTFLQVVKSRLVDRPNSVSFRRLWHHDRVVYDVARVLGHGRLAVAFARMILTVLGVLFPLGGNQAVALVMIGRLDDAKGSAAVPG